MMFNKKHKKLTIKLSILACFSTQIAFANQATEHNVSSNFLFNPGGTHFVLQAGGFIASQGKSQDIGINGLIGDRFTVTDGNDQNLLVGVGVFKDGFSNFYASTMFGLNAFYLAKTYVKGDIIQEQAFTNLKYHYTVFNTPIYFSGKTLINTFSDKYNITFDLGVGLNIIKMGNVNESSLDNGITIPDNVFSGKTHTAFSATAGIGFRFNNLLDCGVPVEIGYRYFYLGEGEFKKETAELLSTLKTGNSYANALIVSISI